MLVQVVFCLIALAMLGKYLPRLREALRRDPERPKGLAPVFTVFNVILALAILIMVLLAMVMNMRSGARMW